MLLWVVNVYLQESHSVESDAEFAFGLQQQEFASLNDSHVARTLQVILEYTLFFSCSYNTIQMHLTARNLDRIKCPFNHDSYYFSKSCHIIVIH